MVMIYTGWWFGTWLLFFHSIWDVILPIDELIFFRGVGQPPTSSCTWYITHYNSIMYYNILYYDMVIIYRSQISIANIKVEIYQEPIRIQVSPPTKVWATLLRRSQAWHVPCSKRLEASARWDAEAKQQTEQTWIEQKHMCKYYSTYM